MGEIMKNTVLLYVAIVLGAVVGISNGCSGDPRFASINGGIVSKIDGLNGSQGGSTLTTTTVRFGRGRTPSGCRRVVGGGVPSRGTDHQQWERRCGRPGVNLAVQVVHGVLVPHPRRRERPVKT